MTTQEKWDQIRDQATRYWQITEIFHDEIQGPLEIVFFAVTDGHPDAGQVAAMWRDEWPGEYQIRVTRAGLHDLRKKKEGE